MNQKTSLIRTVTPQTMHITLRMSDVLRLDKYMSTYNVIIVCPQINKK